MLTLLIMVGGSGERFWPLSTKVKSKKPIIFKFNRYVYKDKHFNIYKDVERKNAVLLAQNKVESGIIFKIKNLKNISLPQIFNILLSHIKVAGSCACLLNVIKRYNDCVMLSLSKIQWLTGKLQTHGRSNTSFNEMIDIDLDCMQNKRGFWYDIKLCF